jgi:oligopeptidase B
MKLYAPYENLSAGSPYPELFVHTSLNDTRVLYVEPTKFIAKLRKLCPSAKAVYKCEMEAGHGGVTGRYAAWKEAAYENAWVLDTLGAVDLNAGDLGAGILGQMTWA